MLLVCGLKSSNEHQKKDLELNRFLLAAAIAVTLAACTTNPDKIGAAYVSPLKYGDYDCQQLIAEQSNIERRVAELHGTLKKENSGDKWATGVGVVLFWPVLFFLAGNNDVQEAEYAQLKGDYDAVQSAIVKKKCSIPAPTVAQDPSDSTGQATIVAAAQPVTQLRAVNETKKTDCEFIKSITKGAGGSGDVSKHLETAMDKALTEAESAGADSYFIADVSTTSTGASVVLEALKCNDGKANSVVKSSDTYNYNVKATGEDPYEAIKRNKTSRQDFSISKSRSFVSRFPSSSDVPRSSKIVFTDDYEGIPNQYPPPIDTTPTILGQKNH